jgi:hypothetical protein
MSISLFSYMLIHSPIDIGYPSVLISFRFWLISSPNIMCLPKSWIGSCLTETASSPARLSHPNGISLVLVHLHYGGIVYNFARKET